MDNEYLIKLLGKLTESVQKCAEASGKNLVLISELKELNSILLSQVKKLSEKVEWLEQFHPDLN